MLSKFRSYFDRIAFLHGPVRSGKKMLRKAWLGLIELFRRLPGPLSLGLPQGFYSDLSLLQEGGTQRAGRVAFLDQGNFEAPEGSLLTLCGRGQHQMQPWPGFWMLHHEAELIGPGLAPVNEDGRLSAEAVYQVGSHPYGLDDPAYFYPRRLSRPRRLEGNWTSLVSRWMSVTKPAPYAHWILEALPRLAFLREFPPDTGIIVPPFRLPCQDESLRLLGLRERCRETSERHLQVENYYFSAQSTMICSYNPFAVDWVRSTFLPLVEKDLRPTPLRFFVRRVGKLRNIINEEEVLNFFREIGWEIIDAAQLSFVDQVRYFSCAEAICSIHGSGFTNAVWCRPGVRLLELLPHSFLGSEVEWIARCIPDAVHRHLIFPADHWYNAKVDVDRVRRELELMNLL